MTFFAFSKIFEKVINIETNLMIFNINPSLDSLHNCIDTANQGAQRVGAVLWLDNSWDICERKRCLNLVFGQIKKNQQQEQSLHKEKTIIIQESVSKTSKDDHSLFIDDTVLFAYCKSSDKNNWP